MLGWRVMVVCTLVLWRDVGVPEAYIGVRLGRIQAGYRLLGSLTISIASLLTWGLPVLALFGALCAFASGLWARYRP